MPSIVWGRHPQEAYEEPYEYGAQDQFVREATAFLKRMNVALNRKTLKYHRDDKSLEKATWMLAHDLVDALMEGVLLVQEKRHRVAARVFRDCVETIDLLTVLHAGGPKAKSTLDAWYENRSIPHRDCRAHLEAVEGAEAAQSRRAYYDELSKFTHRTYRALNESYSLGRGDYLVHDSYSKERMLVLPQVIAAYMAVLADLILQAAAVLRKAIPQEEIGEAWSEVLESHTVPRRFAPGPRPAR